ncbi:MAG: DUF2982 domain-containing protein [Idiomarina sp.]|nr:DUF2982 domain-containing protein [Idiomarina sp.]
MNSPSLVQRIRPHTKRNGRVFIVIGAGGLALLLFVDAQLALPWPLHLSLAAFCLVAMALGVGKLVEPETSLEITPSAMTYFHFRGSWTVNWEDIVRFDVPDVQRGLERQQIPFLGIRLRHYDNFLQQLSPRLAVHLVHQQRPLMLQALRSEMPAHREYLDYVDVPDIYISESGKRYRGVIATFAVRMVLMREMLGYDLYISQNALDRPLDEFIAHLKALQSTRLQHLSDHHQVNANQE